MKISRKRFAFTAMSCVTLLITTQALGSSQHEAEKDTAKKINACALLTSAEVQAVQGEPVIETKPSPEQIGALVMSQCVFETATAAKSVSVALASPGAKKSSALTPRQFWARHFQNHAGKEVHSSSKHSQKNRSEVDKAAEPQSVPGLGDQAYWMGNPIAGSLYVLQGKRFLRISVGGTRKQSERLEKSTKLARNIIARMK